MKKILPVFLFLFIFILQNAAASQSSYISNNWKVDFAYNPKFIKSPTQKSIITDSNNAVHIIYGGDKLYHAFFNGTTWQYEIIDSNLSVGSLASVAIDSNDKLYISYLDDINGGIKFATNKDGNWTIDSVYSQGYMFAADTSIAVDANAIAHISFVIDGNLSYATNNSGSWDITNIDENANASSAIAVDSNGSVHISYDGIASGDIVLRYATNAGGSWQSETVDSTANAIAGEYSSITIDSNDIVHISYAGSDEDNYHYVKHAKKDSGWQIDTVSAGSIEEKSYTSIAIDKNDTIYVSYLYSYSNNNGALKLADYNGTDWNINTLDDGVEYGQIFDPSTEGGSDYYNIFTSLSTDNDDKIHITYLSQNNLKYINNTTGSWVQQQIDSNKDIGRHSVIAIDNYGNYRAAYLSDYDAYSSLSTALNFISENEANETTIDPNAAIGLISKPISNIRIDENNSSHIAYLTSDGNLTYATNNNNTWEKQTIKTGIGNNTFKNAVIDKDNNIYMLLNIYDSDTGEANLTLESNVSGSFTQTIVDHNSNLSAGHLDIDNQNKFHIVYQIDSQIWYATDKNGSVVKEDTGYATDYEPVIAVDESQSAHIAYIVNSGANEYELIYLTNKDGNWTEETISLIADTKFRIESIEVDSNEKVHITYMDGNKLLYANNRHGEWSVENIELGVNGVKQFFESSLALDKNDRVYISYYDYYNRALKYAKHFDLRLDLENIEQNIASIYLLDENGSQILLSSSINDTNATILKDNIPYDHNYSIRFDLNDSSQYWLNFNDLKLYKYKNDTYFTTEINTTNNTFSLNLDTSNWRNFTDVYNNTLVIDENISLDTTITYANEVYIQNSIFDIGDFDIDVHGKLTITDANISRNSGYINTYGDINYTSKYSIVYNNDLFHTYGGKAYFETTTQDKIIDLNIDNNQTLFSFKTISDNNLSSVTIDTASPLYIDTSHIEGDLSIVSPEIFQESNSTITVFGQINISEADSVLLEGANSLYGQINIMAQSATINNSVDTKLGVMDIYDFLGIVSTGTIQNDGNLTLTNEANITSYDSVKFTDVQILSDSNIHINANEIIFSNLSLDNNSSLTVDGDTTIDDNIFVSSGAVFTLSSGNLYVDRDITIDGDAEVVAGDITIGGTLVGDIAYDSTNHTLTEGVNLPAQPTNLKITKINSTALELTWTDNANNEDGFNIIRNGVEINNTLPPDTTSFIDNGLELGEYTYIVQVDNSYGTRESEPKTILFNAINENIIHLHNIRKKISQEEYDNNQSIFYPFPLNLYWVDGFIDEYGSYEIDTGKVILEDETIREIIYNFTNTSMFSPFYHNNQTFQINEQNIITVYELNQSDTYPLMEVKLVGILESELLQSIYSEDYIDFNFSNDARGYLIVKKILKDDLELLNLEKDYDDNLYTSIDTFINDRNSSGNMPIYFNELNSSKYLVFENNTSGVLIEKDIYGNVINSNAGSWLRLSDKTYRYNEDNNLTYANSPDIIVLMPNVEGYNFDENAFALSSHDDGFVYRSIYKSIGDTEMEIMLNAAARDDILNQTISSTLWPKIENIYINETNGTTVSLPTYDGSYDDALSLDPETAIATLVDSNTTLQVLPTNYRVGETTILLRGENNESTQFITLFVDTTTYINLNLLNINLSEHNITNIQIVGTDGNGEDFSIDPNLIDNIHNGDMNISAPVYNPDNNFSIRIDLEENQTLSYWYNFNDSKLYSENNGSNDFKTVINNSNNLFTINLNSSNWILIPVWHLDSNETTIVEDSSGFEIPLNVERVDTPLDDSNFEVTISDPSIANAVIENGVLIVTPKPNQSGTITLTLKVDVDGQIDTTTYTVYIQAQNDAPSISFIEDILKPTNFDDFNISLNLDDIEGDNLNLSISNTTLADINKTWNAQWLTQADYDSPLYIQVSSKPNIEGNATITLTLFDEQGASATRSFNLRVANALDVISDKSTGTAPLDINLSYYLNPLFGSAESIYWDFGDGSIVEEDSIVSHIYENPGNYEIKCTVVTDSGYTLKKSLNIEVIESNLSITLNEGWNFVSLPVKSSLHSQELNATFGKQSVKYIFKYVGNRWALWDNTNQVSSSVKIDRFEDLNSKEGFAIKTTAPTTILFSLDESQNNPDDFARLYTAGWYLVGANEDKTPQQIDALINSQNKTLKLLYLYRDNRWFVYTPSSELDSLIGNSLPRIEGAISRYESFWIYVEEGVSLQ